MNCELTAVPTREELDIAALRAKYYAERDKRKNEKGGAQYINDGPGDLHDLYNHDPHMPVQPRDPIVEDIDVAVLGAGFSGVMAGYYLAKEGVTSFRNIDHAGDFGGVWYWNRYPGIQCDNESYCYLPLLEETDFMPSRRFAPGPEIMGYVRLIAEKNGFADKALFHTLITSLVWDEAIQRWHVKTDRGDDIRARFVIMGQGVLNMPKLPGIHGHRQIQGQDVPHLALGIRLHRRLVRQPGARQAQGQARRHRRHRRDLDPGGAVPRAIRQGTLRRAAHAKLRR